MIFRLELVMLAQPPDLAPDALPAAVAKLIGGCWPGMA